MNNIVINIVFGHKCTFARQCRISEVILHWKCQTGVYLIAVFRRMSYFKCAAFKGLPVLPWQYSLSVLPVEFANRFNEETWMTGELTCQEYTMTSKPGFVLRTLRPCGYTVFGITWIRWCKTVCNQNWWKVEPKWLSSFSSRIKYIDLRIFLEPTEMIRNFGE